MPRISLVLHLSKQSVRTQKRVYTFEMVQPKFCEMLINEVLFISLVICRVNDMIFLVFFSVYIRISNNYMGINGGMWTTYVCMHVF
jgi:hypothetical protein